ncbi:outer membrane protein assembly factor BamE [Accumulibacter sp.]|uniref:outer membrane protein assembly factor BamE domain-containing protein n=1 Tax=Accumulibacter sp. TaxID=2053492 RepID=UPI002614D2D6|nr:outer membrane protein assembly factor BamE [Accumulibacter sp.]
MLGKPFATILLAGLLALVAAGCDVDRLSQLRPGASTAEEVRQIMGKPNLEWREDDGSRIWEYPRTPEGMVNYMLVIGPDQILREVRQVLTTENFNKVKPGMTTDEIRYLLGQPAHQVRFPLQKEIVWDWKTKVEPGMEWYFNVHFNDHGMVTRTSSSFVPRG